MEVEFHMRSSTISPTYKRFCEH